MPCASAQLGVTQCPCAGRVDADRYASAVALADAALRGDVELVRVRLHERMATLAAAQRFEEAAVVRDRLHALVRAARRQSLIDALRAAGRVEIRRDGVRWTIERARLVDVAVSGRLTSAIPIDPPAPSADDRPLARDHVDEAVLLATFIDRHLAEIDIRSLTGEWRFPVTIDDRLGNLAAPCGAHAVTTAPRRAISTTFT